MANALNRSLFNGSGDKAANIAGIASQDKGNGSSASGNSLYEEVESLIEKVKAGNFNVSASTKGKSGLEKDILESINEILAACSEKVYWYESMLDAIPFPMSVTDSNMNWMFLNNAVHMRIS